MGQEMEGAQMNKIDTGIAELLAKQPSDSAEKAAYIAGLQKTVRLLSDEVRNMDELLALLRKKQFGLFNEAEQENKPDPKEPIKKDARGYHILNALEKWKLCKGIQIENVDFDIPIDQRNCSNRGTQMKPPCRC
jgi:transposase